MKRYRNARGIKVFINVEAGSKRELEAITAKALSKGGRLIKAPYITYYNFYQVVLLDPEGNVFRVNRVLPAPRKKRAKKSAGNNGKAIMSAAAISVVLRCLALAFAVVLSSPCHSKHPEELAPDLDQQPALPLEAFTRLPHTEHVQLSPGGDYLAFVRNDGVRSDVIVRDVETNHDAALLSTDNSRFHFNWVRWANDTRLLVSTRKYRRHKKLVFRTEKLSL